MRIIELCETEILYCSTLKSFLFIFSIRLVYTTRRRAATRGAVRRRTAPQRNATHRTASAVSHNSGRFCLHWFKWRLRCSVLLRATITSSLLQTTTGKQGSDLHACCPSIDVTQGAPTRWAVKMKCAVKVECSQAVYGAVPEPPLKDLEKC